MVFLSTVILQRCRRRTSTLWTPNGLRQKIFVQISIHLSRSFPQKLSQKSKKAAEVGIFFDSSKIFVNLNFGVQNYLDLITSAKRYFNHWKLFSTLKEIR